MVAKCVLLPAIFSVFFITLGSLVLHFVPIIIKNRAADDVKLSTPTSMLYKAFQNTSAVTDVYYDYYIFNLTNEEEVMKGGVPKLVEVGPYVYDLLQFKNQSSIKWHPNASIEYSYHQIYTFNQALSGSLKESDIFITPNLGYIGAMNTVAKRKGFNVALAWDLVGGIADLTHSTTFMALNVTQMLWGYNNPILELLAVLEEMEDIILHENETQSPIVALDTNNDLFTVLNPSMQFTGGDAAYNEPTSNPHPDMTQWAGMTSLNNKGVPYWGSTYANMINGTNGEIYYPGIKSSDRPHVFVDNLFRSIILESDGDTTYKDIPLIRFTISQETQQAASENPDNEAFFVQTRGFIARPPFKHQPIWISNPRFMDCDHSLTNVTITPEVDVNANRVNYAVALDVEPITGQIFRANKRYQINTYLNSSINVLPGIQSTYYPVAWINLHSDLPDHMTDMFKDRVQIPMAAAKGAGIAGIVLGSLLAALGVFMAVRNRNRYVDGDEEAKLLVQ